MTTSTVELRPRSVFELLGLTFDLYRKNFLTVIGIAAIVMIPSLAVTALSQMAPLFQLALAPANIDASADSAADAMGTTFAALTLASYCLSGVGLILGIFWPWMEGAITFNVIERVLGHAPGVGESYRATRPRWGALWGSNILAQLGISAPPLIAYFILVFGFVAVAIGAAGIASASSGEDNSIASFVGLTALCCIPLFLASIVLSIVLAVNWAFRAPAVVGEGTDGIQALSRSNALVRGSRWRMFFRLLFFLVIEFVVIYLPTLIVTSVLVVGTFSRGLSSPTPFRFEEFMPVFITAALVVLAISLIGVFLITPARVIYIALNYLDLRTRKENLALQVAGMTMKPISVGAEATAPAAVAIAPQMGAQAQPQQTVIPAPAPPPMPIAQTMSTTPYPARGSAEYQSLTPGQRIGVLYNLIRSQGESADLLSELGMAYLDVGDLGGALDSLVRARTLAPNDADVAYNLMLVHLARRDTNSARQMMSEYMCLEQNPEDLARVRENPRFRDLLL
jgi:hypothetical protein